MPEPSKCPIWGTQAELVAGSLESDGARFYSPRAGGSYRITPEAAEECANLSDSDKAMLTTWLVDQRRAGEIHPEVRTDTIEAALSKRALRFSEKRERFFRALSEFNLKPGDRFPLHRNFQGAVRDIKHPDRMFASIGVETDEECWAIIRMLQSDGILDWSAGYGYLFAKGYELLEQLELRGANNKQAFVAMWFDSEMKEAWRQGFAPAIRDAGYDPFRIDALEHNGKIDDAIVAEIKRSNFLIADFTCGVVRQRGADHPSPRGGVYYEAGLAHGLGMEVIFTCREDRMAHLHFDTRQFAHIVWKSPADLRAQLYNRIAATVKEALGAPGRGKGSVDPSPDPPPPRIRLV